MLVARSWLVFLKSRIVPSTFQSRGFPVVRGRDWYAYLLRLSDYLLPRLYNMETIAGSVSVGHTYISSRSLLAGAEWDLNVALAWRTGVRKSGESINKVIR